MFLRSNSEQSASLARDPMRWGRDMTDPKPSVFRRLFKGLRPTPPAPQGAHSRALIHDLNNVLGVVIGCFDEQVELLSESGELDQAKLKALAEDGLAAALRGAALTRHRPDQSDT